MDLAKLHRETASFLAPMAPQDNNSSRSPRAVPVAAAAFAIDWPFWCSNLDGTRKLRFQWHLWKLPVRIVGKELKTLQDIQDQMRDNQNAN